MSPHLKLERIGTGDPALDEILHSGIPAQAVTVLAGEPGTGKTVLALQLLFHAARQGKKCIYFTSIAEPPTKLFRYMETFDFFDAQLLESHVLFVDLGGVLQEGATRTLQRIVDQLEEHEPAIVVIDSFRALGEMLRLDEGKGRSFVYELSIQMANWGATSLLVGEYTLEDLRREAVFGIADAILRLSNERQELDRRCARWRCSSCAARTTWAASTSSRSPSGGGRATPGCAHPPRMRPPCAPRGCTRASRAWTSCSGEACRTAAPPSSRAVRGRARRCCPWPSWSRARAGASKASSSRSRSPPPSCARTPPPAGGNWRASSGRACCTSSTPPRWNSPRTATCSGRASRCARMAPAGSSSTASPAWRWACPPSAASRSWCTRSPSTCAQAGATLMMTVETLKLLESSVSAHTAGVSFAADNILQLRYVESSGRLDRALSVLKARGIKHSSELRSMSISEQGVVVSSQRFKDLQGVLTGLPSLDDKPR